MIGRKQGLTTKQKEAIKKLFDGIEVIEVAKKMNDRKAFRVGMELMTQGIVQLVQQQGVEL